MADEIHEQDRIAHDDARQGDEADHRGRRERCPEQPVAEQDADQRQRHRGQHHQGQLERAELHHHKDVYPHQRHTESRPHVAEGDPGHVPFTIPQQDRRAGILRLAVLDDHRLGQVAPVGGSDGTPDGDLAVERGLEITGKFCRDHLGRFAVVAEDRERGGLGGYVDDIAKLDHRAVPRQQVRRNRRGQPAFVHHPVCLGRCQPDRDGFPSVRAVGIAHRLSAVEQRDRIEDITGLDLVEIKVGVVQRQAQAFGGDAEAVIHIDDIGHRSEGLADLARHGAAGLGIRTVDFGQQRRHHRRAGGRFHHFDNTAFGQWQGRNPVAHFKGDGMAFARPVGLGGKIDLQVAHLRFGPQIVMAHKAVEIERRGGARMGLDRRDFGDIRQDRRQIGKGAVRVFH